MMQVSTVASGPSWHQEHSVHVHDAELLADVLIWIRSVRKLKSCCIAAANCPAMFVFSAAPSPSFAAIEPTALFHALLASSAAVGFTEDGF